MARPWLLLCASLILCPLSARAEPLPLTSRVSAGRPLHELRLVVEAGGSSTIVSIGSRRHELPVRSPREASVETVRVDRQAAVSLVRLVAANGTWLAVLGGAGGQELLAAGRTDWAGDPGERRMLQLELSAPDANGLRSLRLGTRYEGLSLCGGRVLTAEPRQLNPRTLTLEPVTELPAAIDRAALREVPTTTSAEPRPAPVLQALEPVGSSQVDPATRFLLAPRILVDGAQTPSWPMAAGEFAVFRWSAPKLPIQQLALRLPEAGAWPSAASLIVLADDQAMRIKLPADRSAGHIVTIVPSAPLTTRCLALAVDGLAKQERLELVELSAYSQLDQPGGVDQLVSQLVQDGPAAADAAELLSALGERGALAVAGRYDELSTRGKRRALRVFGKGMGQPDVRARVVQEARQGDAELGPQALAVLQASGSDGEAALRELVLEASALGDAAAKVLASRPGQLDALLRALATERGPERSGLRAALSLAIKQAPAALTSGLADWIAQNPSSAARVSLALAASLAGMGDVALQLVEPLLGQPLEFPERYRSAQALAGTTSSAASDAWLEQQALSASEWMMRREAFQALEARSRERAGQLAAQVARDPYPRVRAAGLTALASGASWQTAAEVARTDAWPLVRTAGARALTQRIEARPSLEGMLRDPSPRVRSAAIDALGSLGARDAWPAIEPLLRDPEEWPDVRDAAVGFARQLCIASARASLAEVARLALRADASEDGVRLALAALHALHDLGGDAARDAATLAGRDTAPPGLAKAHAAFGPSACAQTP